MKMSVRIIEEAGRLFEKDGGHNKFLESVILWLDVNAPLYWWTEADTYRLSTKQSESTMHTLEKDIRRLHADTERWRIEGEKTECPVVAYAEHHFCFDGEEEQKTAIDLAFLIENALGRTHGNDRNGLLFIKKILPSSFMQRRIWCMSYKTFLNIYRQRKDHRLPEWRYFCREVAAKCRLHTSFEAMEADQ